MSAGRNAQTTEDTLASRSGFVNIGDSRGGAIVGSFGAAVAAGDFNNDGFADLAAGAPAEDVGSIFNARAVSAGGRLLTQNSPGVPGIAVDFDSFGANSYNAG